VEVLRRYSNLPYVLKRVQDVLRRIEENDQTDEPGVCSTGRGVGLVPVRERLGDGAVAELILTFQSGTAKHLLAERYGISVSSISRLLRDYRARVKDELS
jgi:hypothetical protein